MQSADVTVISNRTFTGIEASGCSFTGTATPQVHGNIFDQRITFGGVPCLFARSTLVGIAYFDIPNRRLYAAAPVSNRTDGAIFLGTKP